MRLIHTTTLKLHSFLGRDTPRYAILSHCWSDDEVSLEDFDAGARDKAGFEKITNVCRLAEQEFKLDWAWVDTCCIDKTSSAELSESTNSMYQWYQGSVVCYAFLANVDRKNASWMQQFTDSRWFRRGWTLQELLAPQSVRFFDRALRFIATKRDLAGEISAITRIPRHLLLGPRNGHRTASIACRMSWASRRETTREEDIAYCLLGILDVNMPLLYGEGQKAFQRLQEQIISSSPDESIFAWMSNEPSGNINNGSLLASSPKDFAHSNNIITVKSTTRPSTTVTNNGIQVHYATTDLLDLARHAAHWLISSSASPKTIYLDLNCAHQVDDQPLQWITVPLESNATYEGLYHRQSNHTLLQRRINLSLFPRFHAKAYVSQRSTSTRQATHFGDIPFKYPSSSNRWLTSLHFALHCHSRFDSLAILLCYMALKGYSTKSLKELFRLPLPVHYYVVLLALAASVQVAAKAFSGNTRAWHRMLFWVSVCVVAPLPLILLGAFALVPSVVDVLVPYRPFRGETRES